MPDGSPLTWSVADLVTAYGTGDLSPVEVAAAALESIAANDHHVHAFLAVDEALTLQQARESEARYRQGEVGPLDGVPVSVKDAFHLRGMPTTLGSLVHRDDVSQGDSGVVTRLRAAGAVFTGKTNTAEFGQSATTDNLLGPDTANPWDPTRTAGGSSGGAAASVGGLMSNLAVGSDGGGSIRIPAAFCGLVGVKPTPGKCLDEFGFRGMTQFVSAGPITHRVADARVMLEVLTGRSYPRRPLRPLRVGYCARPEGRPVDAAVVEACDRAAAAMQQAGHCVDTTNLPLAGWNEIFGPLVLHDELEERGHLLAEPQLLTPYERRSLEAAQQLDPAQVVRARAKLPVYRQWISDLFLKFDVLLTPTTAVVAFPLGKRPRLIEGRDVDALWGAFPFAAPFNVAGTPAATVPVGMAGGMPVGAQLVTPMHTEALLLEVAEALEEAVAFDRSPLLDRWSSRASSGGRAR